MTIDPYQNPFGSQALPGPDRRAYRLHYQINIGIHGPVKSWDTGGVVGMFCRNLGQCINYVLPVSNLDRYAAKGNNHSCNKRL